MENTGRIGCGQIERAVYGYYGSGYGRAVRGADHPAGNGTERLDEQITESINPTRAEVHGGGEAAAEAFPGDGERPGSRRYGKKKASGNIGDRGGAGRAQGVGAGGDGGSRDSGSGAVHDPAGERGGLGFQLDAFEAVGGSGYEHDRIERAALIAGARESQRPGAGRQLQDKGSGFV